MYKIDRSANRLSRLQERRFAELGFREREHLQEWLINSPDILGEELLIIQKEFDGFDDTRERLDLLALDKNGRLVVIENKLDDSGRDVVWQALKYAAYCSSLTTAQIIEIFQGHLDRHSSGTDSRAGELINDFLGEPDPESLILNEGNSQRIILVAVHFRKEVTSTVMWLRSLGLSVTCVRVTPYSLGEDLILDAKQIIPVPEAASFMIKIAEKEKSETDAKESQRRSHQIRLEYWNMVLEALRTAGAAYANIGPSRDNWIMCGTGAGAGTHYSLNFTQNDARCQLNIASQDKEANKKIFDRLYRFQKQIDQRFGASLEWRRMDDSKASRIIYSQPFDGFNREVWPEMSRWMVEHHKLLECAIQEELEKAVREL